MIEVRPVGWVSSPLRERSAAPRQGDEGAPEAVIHIEEHAREGLLGVSAGASLIVLAVDGLALRVSGLEAIDGTPVLDLKPAPACRPSAR